MKYMAKKLILFAAGLFTAVALSGCALQYGDGLLALPGLPSEYVELQAEINKVLESGASPAAAESGSNRQSIQMVDIDGDGINEAIAFFRENDGDYLIKAYKNDGDKYIEIGSATEVGLTLYSIYYPESSVTGQKFLAVCWGIDESNNYGMTVYSFEQSCMKNILSVQYSGILVGDFCGDNLDELCFAMKDPTSGQMSMRIYAVKGKTYDLTYETLLCSEARNISKITMGSCGDGKGIFIDSLAHGGGYVTDVIAIDDENRLKNITRDPLSGSGINTWRSIEVYSQDIDKDGIIEVPVASSMMSSLYPDEKNKLSWMEYDLKGSSSDLKTYHAPSDGWCIRWMDNWSDSVVVQSTRYSRMIKTVFFALDEDYSLTSLPQPDEDNMILTVYIFSGDNKNTYTSVYEAQEIVEKDGYIYAFSLGDNATSRFGLSAEEVVNAFTIIENEWTLEAYGG